MTAVLEASGVEMVFHNGDELTQVLRGVSLTLDPGEMVALVGGSGSGKSTLLSIVGLLLRPTAGAVSLAGERVESLSDDKRAQFRNTHLGFVFQFHHLLPDFTALENVAFPAAATGGGLSAAVRQRAAALLERVGMSDRAGFRASRLSGGQKQWVAMARALMNRPSLVIADEPTGNLDRTSAERVLELVRAVNAEDGTTFLICTHDDRVAAYCDRSLLLEDGVVRLPGRPATLEIEDDMKTGELARRAQVNIQTLRFYERQGLIRKPGRMTSGYRVYEGADLERVVAIKQCQALGFTLQEVREVLDLHDALVTVAADPAEQVPVQEKLMERARARLAIMDAKIHSLTQMKGDLERLVRRVSETGGACCVMDEAGADEA